MSITHDVTVWCDDCGRVGERAAKTAAMLRRDLKGKGWTLVRVHDDGFGPPRDFCPKCSKKKKEITNGNGY